MFFIRLIGYHVGIVGSNFIIDVKIKKLMVRRYNVASQQTTRYYSDFRQFFVQQKNLDSFAGGGIKKYSIFLQRFFYKIKISSITTFHLGFN